MWHMWIYLGSANANFYYAITLLFGAWQVRCCTRRCLCMLASLVLALLLLSHSRQLGSHGA